MRQVNALFLMLMTGPASACGLAVCVVDPDTLALTRVITFDGAQASPGPGYPVTGLLFEDGAQFGERFAGQTLEAQGDHDLITGAPTAPLALLAGAPGAGLSVVRMMHEKVLNGYGPAGFPKREAQGEGSIAWLFDADQPALSVQLRGGEGGPARVAFFRRDGSLIAAIDLGGVAEAPVAFERTGGHADIAGVVLSNTDAQGLAIDNVRFGRPAETG